MIASNPLSTRHERADYSDIATAITVLDSPEGVAVASLRVLWEDTALNLLLARDRYTSQSIRDEFRSNPHKKAEPFDPNQHGYVTPVANNRFSVVW